MIGALILGLVAGFVARAIVPGDTPGFFGTLPGTLVLGLAGAALGYFLFRLIGIGDSDVFDLGGLIGAIVGTVLLLVVVVPLLTRGSKRT